ncbi:MAG: HepT-like ribonuclease domain-containing protein [Lysobacteraceae bacterium]
MDRLIVERKLDSLQRCIRRIRDKRPDSVKALAADVDLQDVLVLNLSRAVQVCVDLAAHLIAGLSLAPPNTMGEAFDRLVQGELLDAACGTDEEGRRISQYCGACLRHDRLGDHLRHCHPPFAGLRGFRARRRAVAGRG